MVASNPLNQVWIFLRAGPEIVPQDTSLNLPDIRLWSSCMYSVTVLSHPDGHHNEVYAIV
jgi:hypothetical protein